MLKILELFGGIGACSKALERLGIEYEIADYVEIDKYAVASYNAMHHTNFEPQDICKWDKDIEVDLIMHGSPCQDFSLAGLQAGGDEGSGTRSSLMYETIRIVNKLKPKYVIWENVKNMISKKHIHNFNNYIDRMGELGYTSYYQVLNAKDYGIPQNRERVFTISILNGNNYEFPNGVKNDNQIKRLFNFSARQDCRVVYDQNGLCPTLLAGMGEGGGKVPMFIENDFIFPPKQELKLKLKDMLEDNVDEKYYLSNQTLQCNDSMGIILKSKCKRLKSLVENTQFEEGKILNMDLYNQTTNENVSQCLTEPHHNSQRLFDGLRIRKLTPKECWRLMGFDDSDFDKASKVNSNTQLYKQAGNSIVVNVLEAILYNLLVEPSSKEDIIEGQTTIFDFINE